MSALRIIKKYPNRRLYDTEISKYVTLEDIRQLVIKRVAFVVVDANTETNLTKSTLLQIISEQESSISPIFTIEILQHMIRSYGDNMQDLLSRYLGQGMTFFIQQQEKLQAQQAAADAGKANPMNWMNTLVEMQQEFWQSLSSQLFSQEPPKK